MDIASVSTSQGGPLVPAAQTWQVLSPVTTTPPLRFFRRALFLRFPTGGQADRLAIAASATAFQASFLPLDYNALAPGEPSLAASRSSAEGGTAVIVQLDAPRQVRQVRLASSAVPGSGYSVELYRLDGNRLASGPTVSASISGGLATFSQDFTDARFAIRLKAPGGGNTALSTTQVTEVTVRGYPTGPRLGIARPDDLPASVFFWQAPGEIGRAQPASLGEANAGAALADALQRHLDDLVASLQEQAGEGTVARLPAQVDAALVIESDAPCRLQVTSLGVGYRLVQESFPDGAQKQVLRFPGDATSSQTVALALPGNATIVSATLRTTESFRRDRVPAPDEGAPPNGVPAEKSGVHASPGQWAAQEVVPSQATFASGVALALMALVGDTAVQVALQEDWRGRPSGKALAEGTVLLEQAGAPRWATLLFPGPVVLPSQPHWLLVRPSRGQALWLTAAGSTPVRLMEATSKGEIGGELSVLEGQQALYSFLSRGKQVQGQAAFGMLVGAQPVAPGSAPPDGQPDTRITDLASALGAYLASQATTATVSVSLTFSASVPGILTVYPPRVEYEV